MHILGISCFYHDSAATLIRDGHIVAAAQEERFSRKKHDAGLPIAAMKYCLEEGKIQANELDYIVFYSQPFLIVDRFMKNLLGVDEKAREDLLKSRYDSLFGTTLWVKGLVWNALGITEDGRPRFYATKHHVSHAASAFFPSPFDQSVILTVDGVGEWTTLSIGVGQGNHLELKEEIRYPHSLGLLYSAFTYFCGFKVNSGDYKFMGLAPYGSPTYYDKIMTNIIDVKDDGSFALNLAYFDYQNGRTMINEVKMAQLFDGSKRERESRITEREMNIAASVQKVVEEILLKIVYHSKKYYGQDIDSLVMAGGVALNCVANGKILRENIYKNIWIQPAAGDAGGALGGALYLYHHVLGGQRVVDGLHDSQQGSLLGPKFSRAYTEDFLRKNSYVYHEIDDLPRHIAKLLDEQKIIGLFQGRMEFGPRALGNRSIIADSRSPEMQARLNLKIKFRESFRPFAPSVLLESCKDYFELDAPSPYMLLCTDVQRARRLPFQLDDLLAKSEMDMLPVVRAQRSDIPAVTHVDYSARVQTVDTDTNPGYRAILEAFQELTGCGVIVNTSFNVRGEPIVCTPQDAYRCFMRSDMDVLVLDDFILYEQPNFTDDKEWRTQYELD